MAVVDTKTDDDWVHMIRENNVLSARVMQLESAVHIAVRALREAGEDQRSYVADELESIAS